MCLGVNSSGACGGGGTAMTAPGSDDWCALYMPSPPTASATTITRAATSSPLRSWRLVVDALNDSSNSVPGSAIGGALDANRRPEPLA